MKTISVTKKSKKQEFNTRSLVNLTRAVLLAVMMLAISATCKKDEIEVDEVDDEIEDIVDPSPSFTGGRLVDSSFFGMHVNSYKNPDIVPFPVPDNFGSVRFLGLGLEWHRLSPAEGVYDWEDMDISVKNVQDHGKEILFPLGTGIPQWALANPSDDSTGCVNCYTPDIDAWKEFVTLITTRYDGNHGHGKIKYWEIWNEPGDRNGMGEVPDPFGKRMVELAKAAYPIIKAADPDNIVVSPSPQGINSYKWLDKYFAAGGDQYTDVIAFHSYLQGEEPEIIITLIENVRKVQEKYPVLTGKPLWDTEHAWGDDFTGMGGPFVVDEDAQCAWVARHKILSASLGIERSYWYMWNGWNGQPHHGWLYNQSERRFRKPGVAYNEVFDWLVGAEIGTGYLSAGLYQCPIKRPDEYKGLIVWASSSNPSYTRSFKVPEGYKKYRTLDGGTENTSAGTVLTLTMKPILLENK